VLEKLPLHLERSDCIRQLGVDVHASTGVGRLRVDDASCVKPGDKVAFKSVDAACRGSG